VNIQERKMSVTSLVITLHRVGKNAESDDVIRITPFMDSSGLS
jgi:hypothetical protein